MRYNSIYDLITAEESYYQTQAITVSDNFDWNMYQHIRRTVLYKNSRYEKGGADDRPFKNIIRPILNLQYRSEGFDVKDIDLFVNNPEEFYKSFLVKKYHENWARENKIDTFIDEVVESYVDFGGVLVKRMNDARPEVVPLQRLAFCDQTSLLSGPICEKYFYSPDELKDMEKYGWKNIDDVIALAPNFKTNPKIAGKPNQTPGKYIEIYEIHGVFPTAWLEDENYTATEDDKEYSRQMHICTYYYDEQGNKNGIWLYQAEEKELPYKALLRDPIYGRALGIGGAEELFNPQIWLNFGVIANKSMMEHGSKIIHQTSDTKYAARNKILNLQNGEVLTHDQGSPLTRVDTTPSQAPLFERYIAEWEDYAKLMGSAGEAILGEAPSAGTPFKLQDVVLREAHSLHEYRRGKIATFIDEIYTDWIMPYIRKSITKSQEFLSDLELNELQEVAENVVTIEANKYIKELILSGVIPETAIVEDFKNRTREAFMKGGNKRFISILEGELRNLPVTVKINIKGKQKDMAGQTDKLVNIFRQIAATPQILDDPRIARLFNEILESSGLSPIDFGAKPNPQPQQQPAQVQGNPSVAATEPASNLAKAAVSNANVVQ